MIESPWGFSTLIVVHTELPLIHQLQFTFSYPGASSSGDSAESLLQEAMTPVFSCLFPILGAMAFSVSSLLYGPKKSC